MGGYESDEQGLPRLALGRRQLPGRPDQQHGLGLRVNGTAVTAVNAYDASDGVLMDDDRLVVPQLPARTPFPMGSLKSGIDCLAWTHSAVAYRN